MIIYQKVNHFFMTKCEMCGRKFAEKGIVKVEKDGKTMSVCQECATGMKGFA